MVSKLEYVLLKPVKHFLSSKMSILFTLVFSLSVFNISKSGTELSLSTKAFKSANKCKKSLATIPLKKNTKHTLKVIKSRACSNFYRADLLSAATGKYKGLKNAVRVQKGIIKGARPQTSRDSR